MKSDKFLRKPFWQWTMLLFIAFLWGSSFILMKHGLETFSFEQVASMRMFFAFIFFLPFIIKKIKKYPIKKTWSFIIVGFVGNYMPGLLYTSAQTHIDSSLAGVLNSLVPVFTLIIGLILYKVSFERSKIWGIAIGLVGAMALILGQSSSAENSNPLYAGLVIVATIGYAISINETKFKLKDVDALSVTVYSFLLVGPVAGIHLLFSDYTEALKTPDFSLNLSLIVALAFFSTFVAVSIFNVLIKYTDTLFSSAVTYVIPVFALGWGFMDGEIFSIIQIIGTVIILLGISLINKKKNEKKQN